MGSMDWVTTSQILQSLTDFDDSAWTQFTARFRGPVVRFARNLGLNGAEAEDMAQESLTAVAESLRKGRYDPAKGRLHSYLFGVVSLRCRKLYEQRGRRPQAADVESAFWNQAPDEAKLQ